MDIYHSQQFIQSLTQCFSTFIFKCTKVLTIFQVYLNFFFETTTKLACHDFEKRLRTTALKRDHLSKIFFLNNKIFLRQIKKKIKTHSFLPFKIYNRTYPICVPKHSSRIKTSCKQKDKYINHHFLEGKTFDIHINTFRITWNICCSINIFVYLCHMSSL